jgi:hypothetical protein
MSFSPNINVEYQVMLKNGSIYFVTFTKGTDIYDGKYSGFAEFEGVDNEKNRIILYTKPNKIIIQIETTDYYGCEKKTHIVRSIKERQ